GLLRDIKPPSLEGPADADVTLIGWGSTDGVIREAVEILGQRGIKANHLQFKYLVPFHAAEAVEILSKSKRTICIEWNYTGQLPRHLRAESGFTVDDHIRKYDCEPFEPRQIADEVSAILEGKQRSTDVTRDEAREMAYHYIRSRLNDALRPTNIALPDSNGHGEPTWNVELVARDTGQKRGDLVIGTQTGSTHVWRPVGQ